MALKVVSMVELRLKVVLEPERTGEAVAEVCARHGISRASFYRCRRRYRAEGVAGSLRGCAGGTFRQALPVQANAVAGEDRGTPGGGGLWRPTRGRLPNDGWPVLTAADGRCNRWRGAPSSGVVR
jgi:Helix-turn-helix domain